MNTNSQQFEEERKFYSGDGEVEDGYVRFTAGIHSGR